MKTRRQELGSAHLERRVVHKRCELRVVGKRPRVELGNSVSRKQAGLVSAQKNWKAETAIVTSGGHDGGKHMR